MAVTPTRNPAEEIIINTSAFYLFLNLAYVYTLILFIYLFVLGNTEKLNSEFRSLGSQTKINTDKLRKHRILLTSYALCD